MCVISPCTHIGYPPLPVLYGHMPNVSHYLYCLPFPWDPPGQSRLTGGVSPPVGHVQKSPNNVQQCLKMLKHYSNNV